MFISFSKSSWTTFQSVGQYSILRVSHAVLGHRIPINQLWRLGSTVDRSNSRRPNIMFSLSARSSVWPFALTIDSLGRLISPIKICPYAIIWRTSKLWHYPQNINNPFRYRRHFVLFKINSGPACKVLWPKCKKKSLVYICNICVVPWLFSTGNRIWSWGRWQATFRRRMLRQAPNTRIDTSNQPFMVGRLSAFLSGSLGPVCINCIRFHS